ncbi:MAG: hypothetical protein ACFE78_02220 [Candidatus Hodarchaeota archaeon]
MRKINQKKIFFSILGIILGFSIITITDFNNYQGNLNIDNLPNLKVEGSDEYIIEATISDHIWSPDGTKVAYIKSQNQQTWNCELWVADKNPNSPQLTNHQLIYTGAAYNSLYDWKDDWILFSIRFEDGSASSYYGRRELWKIKFDGTSLTQVTFTHTNGIRTTSSNPTWINEGTVVMGMFIPGTNLVYFTAHNGNGWYRSYVCNDDGTDNWQHRSYPDYSFNANFGSIMDPNGNKLLWGHATYWNNPTTLKSCNVDGSDRNTIKSFTKKTYALALADGNTVVWDNNDNIYAIDMDGSNERTVIDDTYINRWWNYNPIDGQELIMASNRLDGNMHLFRIKTNGTGIVPLTEEGPYNDEFPIYSPDGQYLMYRRLPSDFDPDVNDQPYPYELVIKSLVPKPTITITSPVQNDVFGNVAPNFEVSISGTLIDTTWYTLDGGITNITFSGLTGTIDQTEWDKKGDGPLNLRFYINDTLGNSSYSEVTIKKDTIVPLITINSPYENQLFGKASPEFDLTVIESNIDLMWYTLDDGLTNISHSLLNGIIDQSEWNKRDNGAINLRFYVLDKAGNVAFAEVTVIKEVSDPIIIINLPLENGLFGVDAPTYNISVIEPDLASMWYTLDDGLTNLTITESTGIIDETIWNSAPSDQITIKFYAKDTLGNIGYAEVVIEKDATAPTIQVNTPSDNDIFGYNPPNYIISITDTNLDSMWYTLDNGITQIPLFAFTGTIDQTEWDKKGNGAVTIRFYANDTLGNSGYTEVIVTKDLIDPTVNIISPNENEVFGNNPPIFEIIIIESNLDLMWYTLDNGLTNIPFFSFIGTIDQTEWDKRDTGDVVIKFYAIDQAGNEGFAEITVTKDINMPIITINSPKMNDFANPKAPSFNITVKEPHIDLMWYTLDYGINNYYFTEFTGTISQGEWDKFSNGTVVIRFYVKDEGGNEAFSEVSINKDIYAPIITIYAPELGADIVDFPPIYSIFIEEANLDAYWYTIDNGLNNHTISTLTGIIDETVWNSAPDGPIIIAFYAKDKGGNIGFNEVIVVKRTTIQPQQQIPGYSLFILLGMVSFISMILIKRKFKS